MRTIARQFPVVFIAGLTALASSLAISNLSEGVLLSAHPFIHALRSFGLGFMSAGLVLWIDLCREASGKRDVSTPLGILVAGGSALLAITLLAPFAAWSSMLSWAGVAINAGALLIGVAVMVLDPAYPCHLAVAWPDGGLEHPDPHVPALDLRRPDHLTLEPEDLTRIDGIGPSIQAILNQSGIVTYQDVAERSPEELRDILRSAHLRAPVNAAKWRQQAAEIAQNRQLRPGT